MDARRWHIREECLLTVHTHVIVSLLKKVFMIGIECDMPPVNVMSTPEIVLSSKKISSSKEANWIIVDILKYLY